jgi:hypothetical protein
MGSLQGPIAGFAREQSVTRSWRGARVYVLRLSFAKVAEQALREVGL